MSKLNLYWPVYKNLEKEFLKLADYIHITDDQLKVYSMHIADLIVRCAIEIEAISKEIYQELGGNMTLTDTNGSRRDLYFDTDCLDLLERKWKISKKEIAISATNLYFNNDSNKVLKPLYKANKRGSSGCKWKQAYQAVKHDRRNSLKKATIENLLNALGALYILNLYYKDEKFDIGRVYLSNTDFDNRVGSKIFSVSTYSATLLSMSTKMDDSAIDFQPNNDLEKSIYIIKYDEASFIEMHKDYCLDYQITMKNFNNSHVIKKFLEENSGYEDKSVNEICLAAGGVELLTQIFSFQHTQQNKSLRTEAKLNKHNNIYPELLPLRSRVNTVQ
ncbi:hypothetical protein [Lysinibacillus capsici]|uniref:hypothetical protein n=1 Tax=Lysinibacillus capsici TaxID=2115968 RepID=UPI001CD9722C|nr:hypothetical protein [Lysinibacillus capsici]